MRKAVLFAVALAACASRRPLGRADSQIGQPIQLVAPNVKGISMDLSTDHGKVRVVDFWATWCDPCRDELPALDRLYREQGARGLVVYGVSFDDDLESVKNFLREVPVSFPILWDPGGAKYSARYHVGRLPTTFVVDRQGLIRFVHQAYDASIGAKVRREVEQLLRGE